MDSAGPGSLGLWRKASVPMRSSFVISHARSPALSTPPPRLRRCLSLPLRLKLPWEQLHYYSILRQLKIMLLFFKTGDAAPTLCFADTREGSVCVRFADICRTCVRLFERNSFPPPPPSLLLTFWKGFFMRLRLCVCVCICLSLLKTKSSLLGLGKHIRERQHMDGGLTLAPATVHV